jgi:PPK2 family polyphosphate:nucleotide phosphotransferase
MDTERYRVEPGTDVDLASWATTAEDPDGPAENGKKAKKTKAAKKAKKEAARLLESYNERLGELQQLLYAEAAHKVLVVLQGMDTSGKDGTIKHVFHTINPLGVKAANFKRPNDTEVAHDYLWRVHKDTPASGELVIFNRSHYEDVLVVRVHGLVPEEVWRRRYRHLREFERLLADEGTVIRKFFLHISAGEQRARLQERLDNPAKNWKFEHGDIEERRRWDDYQRAYADALSETSTDYAPWYVVPSDQKWFRNLLISKVLIDSLEDLGMHYPESRSDLAEIAID